MGYDWDAHEKLCFQLYIVEKKSLEDIMEYLKIHHDFRPCKRAFQTQFRKWDFPSKRNPAHKNGMLVARVKELWERNLSQSEMLRVLKEDGFEIKKRELVRVRTMNGWLMKAANGERMKEIEDEVRPGMVSQAGFEGHNYDVQTAGQITPDALTDHEVLGAMSGEDGPILDGDNNRRKRRRLKAWASASQNAPVPPRFPSETTLDEAKAILDLSNDVYRQVRSTFSRICEESGISKKSIAGPDRWEAAKDRLVRAMPQLQDVMSEPGENHKSKQLALDVICADTTKRARTLEKRITLAEVKTILGINPGETREVRSAFERIVIEAGLGSKSEAGLGSKAGPAQWDTLKKRWRDSSQLVQRIFAHGAGDPACVEKERALDVLARDVMKRLRDDISRRDNPPKGGSGKAKPPATRTSPDPHQGTAMAQTTQPELVEDIQSDTNLASQYGNAGQVSSVGQAQMLMPVPMQTQATDPLGHSAARILSNALLGQTNMVLDSHLGSSLLLAANAQAAFVDQQYVQQFTASQSVYHAPAPTSVAIYLRLHPSSTFVVNANLWIATLSTHSMQELRHVAANKFPGAICLRVEGVLKDGKGGEMPLQIDQDPELAAYLAHLQGATPVFNVQLVPGWKTS